MRYTNKPFSEACEQNKLPILEVIGPTFAETESVLEVGSGTGQHAVFFAASMPHLRWQTADVPDSHSGIRVWLEEAALPNVLPPIRLDVAGEWPRKTFDGVFSANTAHIMSLSEVEAMFRGVARVLRPDGLFALYGPFNYRGAYTSRSNAEFDRWLKARDPNSGIRDFEYLNVLAETLGLSLVADHAMPANNRTLIWRKSSVRGGSRIED
ncbi:MAG: DUF938 domain-containing protein [Pseudomonadota bacterium]|nr:DUF938 domain-containing protein [Pseudomonadota bacterium]